jgi:hypothetical protein
MGGHDHPVRGFEIEGGVSVGGRRRRCLDYCRAAGRKEEEESERAYDREDPSGVFFCDWDAHMFPFVCR